MAEYVLLMAGGKGERLWPLSRVDRPKQFIPLLPDGRSLFQASFTRAADLVGRDAVYVVTGARYLNIVLSQMPDLDKDHLIVEPEGRDTAPCLALGTTFLVSRDRDATVLALPSDHYIADEGAFKKVLTFVFEVAKKTGYIVTVGIRPARPETGFGYLLRGDMISLDDVGNRDPEIQAFGVVRFVEKPDLSAAEAMIREGQWYWNGGIFCYSAESFLSLCKTLLPQDMPALCELQTQLQSAGLDPSSYRETFSTLTKISVDYGIMEKGLWVGAALEVEDRSEGGAHHMRILYLVDAFPYPPTDGLRLRPFNILKWFPQGHTIGLVCLEELTPGAVPPLLGVKQSFGLTGVVRRRSVINIPRRYPLALYSIDLKKAKNQLVEVLDQFRPDIINCESLSLGYGLCRWKPDVPVVNSVPDCNSLYHRLRFERAENPKVKLIELVQWLKFVNFERDCYKCFNYNVVVGERDKNELIRICGPIPITVIPNGVDCQFFNGNGIEPQTATIAFVGVMNYPPNVDAVIHFTRNVLPLVKKRVPEVRFIIAGKTPSKSVINLGRLPGVEVTGYVEDIRKIYGRTSVVVVPIRFGTGVKNKVLEAMAMSKPVVATTEAVENIPVINGENIIIANEPMAMAEETISLLKDRDRARSIGYAAREHVHKLLSWAAVGRQLLSIYEDVLG